MLKDMSKSDKETVNTAGDIQAACSRYDEKSNKPKPLKGHQSPELRANQKSPLGRNTIDAEVGPLVKDSKRLDFTAYLRFDERGMIIPHSILGSLEEFHSYLESKGEKHLLKKIPKPLWDPTSEAMRSYRDTVERKRVSDQRSIQSHALQRWDEHMTCYRQTQEELSNSLNRPAENLLMNQAKHFRETQEQRELLKRVMPFAHSGYGYRVGSEFWSLPQHYGDELSGIRATLTQTERGQKKPITHVGHPNSIQMEMGIFSTGTERPASRSWAQSAYLEQKCRELQDILQDMEIRKPDFSELEVIGTRMPLSSMSEPPGLFLQKEDEKKKENEMTKEKLGTPTETDDVHSKALPFPALRIQGHLASWTGNQAFHKGQVGISTCVLFESQTGQTVSTDLELHNEGSTVIFYSWQKLPKPQTFFHLCSQNNSLHFSFNYSSGVIRPSETQRVEFIFKSEEPGHWTERWQLNTHPLLMQGASIQVRLSGTAFRLDTTADQRCFIENKLEKVIVEKLCRSIVQDIVGRVHTPERPRSPAELYITEEQLFHNKNPKFQYHYQPVEDLKTLWRQVNQQSSWDFSVDTLRQAVLSLPDGEPVKEESFSHLNSLYLQLSEPPDVKHHLLTPAIIGRQLWRKLLDLMAEEAMRLRDRMGLPDKETWTDMAAQSPTDDKIHTRIEPTTKEERSGSISKYKDTRKSEGRSPTADSSLEEDREKQGKHPDYLADTGSESNMEIQSVDSETFLTYKTILHKKVYALMEDLVGNLCDLMDDLHVGDPQSENCCA